MNRAYFQGLKVVANQKAEPFIFEIDTTRVGVTNSDQFQFTGAVGEYDVLAFQGGVQVASYSNLVNQQTITLPSAGAFELRVIPKGVGFDKLRFNNGGDKLKMGNILQWGDYGINENTHDRAFNGCENITEIAGNGKWFDVVTNTFRMFENCSLTSLPSGMDFPSLTIGQSMFSNNSLTSLPSGMGLPSLTNGNSMFQNNSLTSLPSGMELPLLTNGSQMFFANSITSLPSGMELPNLSIGFRMFFGNSLTSLPSGMELPNLTNGFRMFDGNSLTSLPSGMELPLLSNGGNMFLGNTLNTTRYSQLLIDLEANNSNNNVTFHGGNSKYNTAGEIARNALTARGWTITDGGLE